MPTNYEISYEQRLRRLASGIQRLKFLEQTERYEDSLIDFVEAAWPSIDAAPYKRNWAVDAVAEHLQAVTEGEIKRLLINIPFRSGKPVERSALVLTKRGLIPLGEVVKGDLVFTHRSRWRRVTAVHQQGLLPVVRLTSRSGRAVEAAHDHPFLTPEGWVDAGKLRVSDVLGLVPMHGLQEQCGSDTITPEEARLLGYLVGDGHCSGTPNITSADDDCAADIMHCARAVGFDPSEQKYRMASTGYMLRRIALRAVHHGSARRKKGYLGPVRQWVSKHGLDHQSSYTKMVPQAVMRGSNEIVSNFLAAYWSCDGHVLVKESKGSAEHDSVILGCDTVNRSLAMQVQALLLRLGIHSRVRKKTLNLKTAKQGDTYTSYPLVISDQDNVGRFALQIRMPHSKNGKLLAARKRRFDFDRSLIGDVVDEIEALGEPKECMCLTVEEDESFTANGFAVHNSKLASVCFPAWTWARRHITPVSGPQTQILCASYGDKLGLPLSNLTRRLILSPWYQQRWASRVKLTSDQNTKHQFDTTAGGSRITTSVTGGLLGIGGTIILVDDPHSTEDVESEAERETVLNFWREIASTRLNDPENSAIIVIMQRLHEEDVSGHILGGPNAGDWTHLMIPMSYDWPRHCATGIGWQDPRGLDDAGEPLVTMGADGWEPRDGEAARELDERQGELMWPDRFGAGWLAATEAELGPYMSSGRLQQQPQPKHGGIFKRHWFQLWAPPSGKFPQFEYIVASLDSAFTEDQENDPSALTVWGTFMHPELKRPCIMLIDAWRKFLEMHGEPTPRLPQETPQVGDDQATVARKDIAWKRRVSDGWGLVEWVGYTCRLRHVDRLLIEGKASGITAAQEVSRLYAREPWSVELCPVKGDKVARALSVQPTFAQGLIWAPAREWAETLIDEMCVFPKGRFDDGTDSATQAIKHLRTTGLAPRPEETEAELMDKARHRSRSRALYPA